MTDDLEVTLGERQKTHGEFEDVAHRSQMIKAAIRSGRNWSLLSTWQRESIEMLSMKLARILEGDANNADHWHDIAGYAQLVVRHLDNGIE